MAELLERADRRRPGLLRALAYHDVPEAPAFEAQVAWLQERFHLTSIEEVLAARAGRRHLPPRSVLLTFDDAYRSFATVAWPVLRRRGLAAALFVPTAYPGGELGAFSWDRVQRACQHTARRDALAAGGATLPLATAGERRAAAGRAKELVKALPHAQGMALVEELCRELGARPVEHDVLSWNELRRLAREGVAIGAHTRSHPLLTRVGPGEARTEILGSLDDLRRELGRVPALFAYPDGQVSAAALSILRQARVA